MQSDDGFGFMFENQEADRILLAKVKLDIENLQDKT
jgi:hypothetical protein